MGSMEISHNVARCTDQRFGNGAAPALHPYLPEGDASKTGML